MGSTDDIPSLPGLLPNKPPAAAGAAPKAGAEAGWPNAGADVVTMNKQNHQQTNM